MILDSGLFLRGHAVYLATYNTRPGPEPKPGQLWARSDPSPNPNRNPNHTNPDPNLNPNPDRMFALGASEVFWDTGAI